MIVEEPIAVTNEPLPAQQVAAAPSRQVATTSAPASTPLSPMAVASAYPTRAPAAPPSVASPAIPPLALGIEKVERPVFANNAPPEYPALAQANGWHGTVLLRITIDESGLVREVKIESSSGFAILDQAAQKAVATWKRSPPKRMGERFRRWNSSPSSSSPASNLQAITQSIPYRVALAGRSMPCIPFYARSLRARPVRATLAILRLAFSEPQPLFVDACVSPRPIGFHFYYTNPFPCWPRPSVLLRVFRVPNFSLPRS
ncbi:MAG: energy transducer TonB [Pirellulales bacterium]